jgi:hypothetical protein
MKRSNETVRWRPLKRSDFETVTDGDLFTVSCKQSDETVR